MNTPLPSNEIFAPTRLAPRHSSMCPGSSKQSPRSRASARTR